MTIIEALNQADFIRRKNCIRHCGVHGDGWVSISMLFSERRGYELDPLILTKEDILADDWEAQSAE